jgi:hypothetical protein
MTHLKPSHEQLVQEALSSGRYRHVDEFLDEALSASKNGEAQRYDLQKSRAAVASIREFLKSASHFEKPHPNSCAGIDANSSSGKTRDDSDGGGLDPHG